MVYMYIGIVRLWHIKHLKAKYYCIILKFLRNNIIIIKSQGLYNYGLYNQCKN